MLRPPRPPVLCYVASDTISRMKQVRSMLGSDRKTAAGATQSLSLCARGQHHAARLLMVIGGHRRCGLAKRDPGCAIVTFSLGERSYRSQITSNGAFPTAGICRLP